MWLMFPMLERTDGRIHFLYSTLLHVPFSSKHRPPNHVTIHGHSAAQQRKAASIVQHNTTWQSTVEWQRGMPSVGHSLARTRRRREAAARNYSCLIALGGDRCPWVVRTRTVPVASSYCTAWSILSQPMYNAGVVPHSDLGWNCV